MHWTDLLSLAPESTRALCALPQQHLSAGTVLFHPGDAAQGFVVVVRGRIEVFLTAASGREILLYAVEPGQSCIQTTLGLLAGEAYLGEALTATEAEVVMIPRALFLALMDRDPAFRGFVLGAFARRMSEVTRLLERVAFGRIESRLAQALLDLAQGDAVHATQSDLAARIGSAREVVTRRLDQMARAGLVQTDRGMVRLIDLPELRRLAAAEA